MVSRDDGNDVTEPERFKGPECQRIPLAFRHVLRLMNHELPNDNHHSYIIN